MDEDKKLYTIILRHDTSTNWTINNPVLSLGEYGVEDDTHRVKRGDGSTQWEELKYEHFGLEYMLTFANILGEVADNEKLTAEFATKIDKTTFDDTQNSVIAGLTITTDDERVLGKITKLTKNVNTDATSRNFVEIKSSDNSITGIWSIDDNGVKILDLKTELTIPDWEIDHRYYVNHTVYYKRRLYRCITTHRSNATFDPEYWVMLTSQHSNDIIYDNSISGLDSTDVKNAIDELKEIADTKVVKTSRANKVYGTDSNGEQMLYDKDSLRTVDTVNHIAADANKNIQLDASQINYDDSAEVKKTIKEKLDSKVDKTVAGIGEKIVKDVVLNYNEGTGALELKEEKLSLEDGSMETQTTQVDVVSEQELEREVSTLNTRINTEVETLNNKIDTEVTNINERINTEVNTLNSRITTEVDAIYNTINTTNDNIQNRINTEVTNINERIDATNENVSNLSELEAEHYNTLSNALVENINNVVNYINENVNTINNRIDNEVSNINNSINTINSNLHNRINTEVSNIMNTINTTNSNIQNRIDIEVGNIVNTINTMNNEIRTDMNNGLNLKIDKDIADSIVVDIEVSKQTGEKIDEPTLKITSKNTDTETEIVKHLHFVEKGDIELSSQNDHIVVDSTVIDNKIIAHTNQITDIDSQIHDIDQSILDLQSHDTTQDATIENHTTQLGNMATTLGQYGTRITEAENDITALETENAQQETHLTNLDTTTSAQANAIQANADAIVDTNQTLSEVDAAKVDKTFASQTDNKVVGNFDLDAISNSEIMALLKTFVSPVNGAKTTGRLHIISSNNTITGTTITDAEGNITGIDLATNLDTDVNYFVTTETLDTRIAYATTIPMSSLTPTGKANVELQDIITDGEGTWARVSIIDVANQTVTAITFHKHAQAVWGTIKGNIAEQQDLQLLLTDIDQDITAEAQARESADTTLQGNIDAEEQAREAADTQLQTNIEQAVAAAEGAIDNLSNELDTEEAARIAADATKVDKTSDANKVYGTDADGNQTTYNKVDFGKVDTVNGVNADTNKNVQLDAGNINLDDTATNPEDLYNVITSLRNQLADLIDAFEDITKTWQYEQGLEYKLGDFVYVDDLANNITYVARVIVDNYAADNTEATTLDSFIKDVEDDKIIRVGIPAEYEEPIV